MSPEEFCGRTAIIIIAHFHFLKQRSNAITFICGDFNMDLVNQEIKGHQYLKYINEAFIEVPRDLEVSWHEYESNCQTTHLWEGKFLRPLFHLVPPFDH